VIQGDNYTLYQGDCLDILPTLAAGSVGAVITDPPYGIGLSNHAAGKERRDDWDTIIGDESQEVGRAVIEWADNLYLPMVCFASPWLPWPGKWRNLVVWDKGGAVGGGGDTAVCLKRTWELIQVKNNRFVSSRYESVWRRYINPQDTSLHIAQKPIDLMERLIEAFTSPADVILDPFMGSGSTGVACVRTGRKFIGIEVDPGYFEIAHTRIANAAGDFTLTPRERASGQMTLFEAD
jgi:DNA modification methylase